MTPEQKIITIAEFEGWKELRDGRWKLAETGIVERFLPPYLTSRDAICGAVARLDSMEFFYFVGHLERICGTDGWEIMTPAQLADALLLTLGYKI